MNWDKSEGDSSMLNQAFSKILIPVRPYSTLSLCLEDMVGLGFLAPDQNIMT